MKIAFAALLAGVAASTPALAQDLALKPGLWQITLTRQVIDGRDLLAERAAKYAQQHDDLARLSADQLHQTEERLGGVSRVCVVGGSRGRRAGESLPGMMGCNPSQVAQRDEATTFEFQCEAQGAKVVGRGERTPLPNGLHSRTEATLSNGNGRRNTVVESELVYLGSDCQGVAPR